MPLGGKQRQGSDKLWRGGGKQRPGSGKALEKCTASTPGVGDYHPWTRWVMPLWALARPAGPRPIYCLRPDTSRPKIDRLCWLDGPGTQMVRAHLNRSDRTVASAAHSPAVRCNQTDSRGLAHPLPKFGPSLRQPRQRAHPPNYLGGPPASGTQATLLPPKTLAQNLSGSNGSGRDGSRCYCRRRAYHR
jgi:hypothetical protein